MHHAAQVTTLVRRRPGAQQTQTQQQQQHVIVANVHLYWNPLEPEIKLLQAALIVAKLDALRRSLGAHAAVVLCGDFNVMPRIVRDARFEDARAVDGL